MQFQLCIRLQEERAQLLYNLGEKQTLNETLQMELEVYDRMHQDRCDGETALMCCMTDCTHIYHYWITFLCLFAGKGDSEGLPPVGGLDLSILLEEIRKLRNQLIKTISNNNLLQQKLEEKLKFQQPSHHLGKSL